MKAFINWVLPPGQTFPYDASDLLDDGTTEVFLLNDAGGGIDISASAINVGKNETVILTIEALPGHNVSVTTADPAHTVFEYNRYDFTGTSKNIINIAPADTISIPADIGDCGSQADAMNIHGVWKMMNADGIRKFEVHFTDIGTYKITATDYGTDYPTATRLDEEDIEIIVSEKNVTFDVPSIVALGEKITIKGTSNTGDWVAIAFDDVIPNQAWGSVTIGADGEFRKEIYTGINSQSAKLKAPGSVRVTAFIDLQLPAGATLPYDVSNWPLSDDGSTKIFLVPQSLTAELSNSEVALGDSFTVSGTAKGPRFVEILTVSPKGPGGEGLGTGIIWWVLPYYNVYYPGCTYDGTSVSETDYTFSKKLDVQDTTDTGTYLVVVLSRGIDGQYGDNQGNDLEEAICNYAGDISTKTQEQVLSILKGLTTRPGSDDLMRILRIKVGWTETLTLNTIADVIVGNPLEVTGETSRKDGSIIWITVKRPYYEIVPQAAIVKDNKFSATFDTTGAQLGTYTVKADDGYGYTASTNVNILAETPAPTSFDTGKGSYPSIMGTHKGTLMIQRMYTYPCTGTGGHSEYAAFYDQNGTKIGEGHWKGYQSGDYHYITFDAPFTLEIGETYNYTIRTGSYPQIIHNQTLTTENGTITCAEFIDANGKRYNNWIPAIRLD